MFHSLKQAASCILLLLIVLPSGFSFGQGDDPFTATFENVSYGDIPTGWNDLYARKPSRNWMVDGQSFLRPVLKGHQALLAWAGKAPADVELTATFKKTPDEDVFFGLAGRITDSLNFYGVYVVGDNKLQITKVVDGKPVVLTELVLLKRYRYPEVWSLTAQFNGSVIAGTVRDASGHVMAYAEGNDEAFAKGPFGLHCSTYAAAKSVRVNATAPLRPGNTVENEVYNSYKLIKPAPSPEAINTAFPAVKTEYDIVVAGAGTGGWAAAVQAARMGQKVLLLEETDWIGGQMAAAAVTSMDEAGPQVRERGIYRQFHESMVLYYYTLDKDPFQAYYHGRSTQDQREGGYEPAVARAMLYGFIADARNNETGGSLDISTRTRVAEVIRENNQVTAIKATHLQEKGEISKQIACKILIDATEHGDVIPLTGAPYRVGNTKSEALDLQGAVQDFTYTGVIREYPDGIPDHLKITTEPPNYQKYKRPYANKTSYGNWGLNRGRRMYRVALAWRGMADTESPMVGSMTGWRHTLADLNGGNDYPVSVATIETPAQRLADEREGIYRTLSIIYYLQNELGVHWALAEDQGYNTLYNRLMMEKRGIAPELLPLAQHLPQMPYVRESRRIIGIQTLVADDLARGSRTKHFPTSIAMGDYFMDLHHTYESLEFDLDKTDADLRHGPFQVPFEVFIPASLDGFLPAEKNFSQSRLVSGATRLQPITMLTGQAVGVIASLAVAQGVQPRALNPLQVQLNLLDEGAALIPRWHADVPWNTELWKAVQLLCLYKIMDRPGNIEAEDGMEFTTPEKWGVHRPISEKEAADGLYQLARLLQYTPDEQVKKQAIKGTLSAREWKQLITQTDPKLAEAASVNIDGDQPVTQSDFALFALDCIRKAVTVPSSK